MKIVIIIFLIFYPFCCIAQQSPQILEHKNKIVIRALEILNTPFRETNLSISPDGKFLFFMSDRGGQPWTKNLRDRFKNQGYDGNIYFSKKENFNWTPPQSINSPINTPTNEDEPVISPDGQCVYFQSWRKGWEFSNGPYYKADLDGTVWKNTTGLGDSITIFFKNLFKEDYQAATDGMTISPDGNTFIIAYGKYYDKNMNFYYCKKNKQGNWTMPRKMKLNTMVDNRSVFLAADGKTLYFASSGYGGFGGLDIFRTELDENGNHGEIINLGKPFNTENDDYGFIITASGNKAYFIRDGDIYFAELEDANPLLKPRATKIISGTVKDVITGTIKNKEGKAIATKVTFRDKLTKQIIATSRTNTKTGEFSLVSNQTHGNFELTIEGNGFDHITDVTLENDSLYEELKTDFIFSDKLKLVDYVATLTVYFDYDKAVLTEEYQHSIKALLQSYATKKIKNVDLQGFTDGDGSVEYNQQLGLKRAKAVANYLQQFSIQASAIHSFGKLQPIASNNTDEGKAINRRVEITITYHFD